MFPIPTRPHCAGAVGVGLRLAERCPCACQHHPGSPQYQEQA